MLQASLTCLLVLLFFALVRAEESYAFTPLTIAPLKKTESFFLAPVDPRQPRQAITDSVGPTRYYCQCTSNRAERAVAEYISEADLTAAWSARERTQVPLFNGSAQVERYTFFGRMLQAHGCSADAQNVQAFNIPDQPNKANIVALIQENGHFCGCMRRSYAVPGNFKPETLESLAIGIPNAACSYRPWFCTRYEDCFRGVCLGLTGVCTLLATDATCTQHSQCSSGHCEKGRCVLPPSERLDPTIDEAMADYSGPSGDFNPVISPHGNIVSSGDSVDLSPTNEASWSSFDSSPIVDTSLLIPESDAFEESSLLGSDLQFDSPSNSPTNDLSDEVLSGTDRSGSDDIFHLPESLDDAASLVMPYKPLKKSVTNRVVSRLSRQERKREYHLKRRKDFEWFRSMQLEKVSHSSASDDGTWEKFPLTETELQLMKRFIFVYRHPNFRQHNAYLDTCGQSIEMAIQMRRLNEEQFKFVRGCLSSLAAKGSRMRLLL